MAIEQLRRLPFLNRIWQRLESIPLPKTEESVLLRILVQLLVVVGIIATDIAAETQMSLWAIPLSIAGAVLSWYRRKHRNVTLKFLLAIAMLLMLVFFFGNLFPNRNDTRLVLAQLLIQLQVLHSFALPRRQDLGYSIVIGLILLGVAATISQTLTFAPFLLVFLVFAVPVLVLDYRSRLGLESLDFLLQRRQQNAPKRRNLLTYSPLSPQRLVLVLLVTIALGLAIFAVMPRFPGYQLQTLPVSMPTNVDEEEQSFNQENQGISNPGYVREGRGTGAGTGTGQSPTKGAGKLDPVVYYGFNNEINQNLRGQMTKKLVMRVRSQAPGFWRVLGFDQYTGQGWKISRDQQLINIKRPTWTYRFVLSPPETLGKTKQVIQSYTAVAELPNIIPALSHPTNIYFPTKEIAIDPEASLRSPLGLIEGLTYTVISEVPYRDRTLLGKTSTKYPSSISKYYLQVPDEIQAKVKQKAEELLAKSPNTLTNNYEKALYLTQALKQLYTIQSELPFFSEKDDLVNVFLFRYEGGYPDHFSTVLTIMLRSLGIPARLAVGFAPGQFNPFTGYYLIHNTDAYALTEVYFPKFGWFAFDPIPGHEIIPPSFEEEQTFSVLKQFWQWVSGWLPDPITSFISNLWKESITLILRFLNWLWGFFRSGLIGLISGLIFLISLSFVLWLVGIQIKNWFTYRHLAKLAPMARLYQQMLAILKVKGYPKHPAQTPLEYAQIAYQHHQTEQAEIIAQISQAYVRWRYGEQIENTDYLQQQLQALTRSFKKMRK